MGGLYMTLMVKNEVDIVDYNISYHRRHGVDHFIVTDHDSTDGTLDMLKKHESLGYLTLLHKSGPFEQALWVTEMSELAKEAGASYIINADADEFFFSTHGNLKEEFTRRWRVDYFLVTSYLALTVIQEPGQIVFPRDKHLLIRGRDVHLNKVMYRVTGDRIRVSEGNHLVYANGSNDECHTKTAEHTFIIHFHTVVVSPEEAVRLMLSGEAAWFNSSWFVQS